MAKKTYPSFPSLFFSVDLGEEVLSEKTLGNPSLIQSPWKGGDSDIDLSIPWIGLGGFYL